MAVIQLEASPEQLLQAVAQLPSQELARFVEQVVALRAAKTAPHLSRDETTLLLTINQSIPGDIQRKYDALITKRRNETLAPQEHSELTQLTDQVESLEAKRVAALAELARLRHTTLASLMQALGIQASAYV